MSTTFAIAMMQVHGKIPRTKTLFTVEFSSDNSPIVGITVQAIIPPQKTLFVIVYAVVTVVKKQ